MITHENREDFYLIPKIFSESSKMYIRWYFHRRNFECVYLSDRVHPLKNTHTFLKFIDIFCEQFLSYSNTFYFVKSIFLTIIFSFSIILIAGLILRIYFFLFLLTFKTDMFFFSKVFVSIIICLNKPVIFQIWMLTLIFFQIFHAKVHVFSVQQRGEDI